MKKLGTHNSLSYLKPQWWLIPFNWIGKCQNLTLSEQYKKGVRYFDIRVKYINDEAKSGHGLLTYDIRIEEVLNFINNLEEKCNVRIFLENSKSDPTKYFNRFERDIKIWIDKFKNIKFLEGGCRYSYRRLIEEDPKDKIEFRDCYWKKGYTLLPYPKGYAKDNNKINHIDDNDKIFSIYDFIEI